MILLDTNAFLWLGTGDSRLGPRSRAAIEQASGDDDLGICAITPWEISMLVERKRISLSADTLNWLETTLVESGIDLIPLHAAIAVDAGRLPGNVHGDPADRLMIATARYLACPLLTSDRKILAYAEQGHVQILDARN